MSKKAEFWKSVRHFTPQENWGDVDKISDDLIHEVDAFREKVSTPIFISCGTQGKHLDGSYHYQGLALDILFPEKERKDLPNLFLTALKYKFTGIGLYTDWKYKDKVIGGMHVDFRPSALRATWIGVQKSYIGIDFQNLYHLFVKDAQV